ncbi:hypothetical protein BT63DRAFT_452989 [Microthyrium microscopicum]|uniref:RTA1 domain protein n=1 Tax=Microthyrium microscopicum TaxID=703497 RepID=A0A6A6UJU0_9PEZI|nr:hypothetical protein BT63DRAFT_452989 [Microthyrium microscopicum]
MTYVDGSVYYYAPNKVAPAIFAVLFAISGVVHFIQTWRYGSWRTTGLMPWAAILLTTGFAFREYGAFHYKNVDILIVNSVLIFSGPPVYALINYMVLSRILYYAPYLSPLHPGRVLTTFLAADLLCEVLLVNGVQRVVNTRFSDHQRSIGEDLVKAGLLMQAIFFIIFIMIGVTFQWKATKAGVLNVKLQRVLYVMYVSSLIITARCIYRIVEYFQGYTGQLFTHEVYFWVFEASLMWVNTAMLNVFHPGRSLPRSNKVFLAKDGVTELHGPGWKDDRNVLLTIFDPFDIGGLITGRDKKTKFWELSPQELEALTEKDRIERAERYARPRPAWRRFVDPFHLFDHTGKFQRMFDWMDGEEPLTKATASSILQSNKHKEGQKEASLNV